MIKKKSKDKQEIIYNKAIQTFIEENMKAVEEIKYGSKKNELTIKISPNISLETKASAVKTAADFVFTINGEGVESYLPEVTEFAIRYGVIKAFTDFELPDDIKCTWAIVLYTPLFEDVQNKLAPNVVREFIQCIINYIEAKKQEIYHSASINKIFNKSFEIVEKISGEVKNVDFSKFTEGLKDFKLPEGLDFNNIIKFVSEKK